MADDINGAFPDGDIAATAWDDGREECWPLPSSAALVAGSSVVLWSLIIAGARWLVA